MTWEEQWAKAAELLTEREWRVLSRRAGIGSEPMPWSEIGYWLYGDERTSYQVVSGERCRQIAKRALGKIEDEGWLELHFMLSNAIFGRYRMRSK